MSSAPDLVVLNATQLVIVGDGGAGPRVGGQQSELDVIAGGSMHIRDGRIVAVGATHEVIRDLDLASVRVIDAAGKVVLPGLVDAHSHPLFAGKRVSEYARRLAGKSRAEIAAEGGGIQAAIRTTRAADDATLREAVMQYLSEMPRYGVTTVEVKSGYGQTTQEELRQLRLIAECSQECDVYVIPTFLGAHIVPEGVTDSSSYVETVVGEMLPAVSEQGIARAADVSCGPNAFSPEQCARMVVAAAEYGLPTHVHADSSSRTDGWRTAAESGALTADHLTFTSEGDLDEVGRVDTIAVLVPFAELVYLDPQRAPARSLIEHEIAVAVAPDYCSSVPAPPLLDVLPFAAAWYRLTPEEVLVGATVNAAYALAVGDEVGTLTPGKRANFTVADVADYRVLMYDFGRNPIERTYVDGRLVYAR